MSSESTGRLPPGCSALQNPCQMTFCLGYHIGQDQSEALPDVLWPVDGLCFQINVLTESMWNRKKEALCEGSFIP